LTGTEADNFVRSQALTDVVSKIADLCAPDQIYLYNQRINSKNEVSSFKLCVVADVADKFAAEHDIYLEIDSDIPFDVLIYTTQEWEELTRISTTFAYKISQTGVVVFNG
jgi:hypothetical protein